MRETGLGNRASWATRSWAALGVQIAAWLLLIAGLVVIAMNPAVPSIGYAILWAGAMATARGVSLLVPWVAAAVDISLLFACFLGLEIGGLIVVPSILAFLIADLLAPANRSDANVKT
jgi:hypothetical protein